MAYKTDFVVIGLGRFGMSVTNALIKAKRSVMVLDKDLEKINKVRDKVAFAAALDATDESALKEVGIKNAEHVIVAIGSDFENGLLTTVTLQQMGVKNITVKSSGETQSKVYRHLGIQDIVFPELELGNKVAKRLTHTSFKDFIELGADLSVIRIDVANAKIVGQPISATEFREKFGANIIAITREEKIFIPTPSEVLQHGDSLSIIVNNRYLSSIESYVAGE